MANMDSVKLEMNPEIATFTGNKSPINEVRQEEGDIMEVLDALLDIQKTKRSYSKDCLVIYNAVELNEKLQEEITRNINSIDQKINTLTHELLKTKTFAIEEGSLNKLRRHDKYSKTVSYFDENELLQTSREVETEGQNTESVASEEEEIDDAERQKPKRKAWTEKERKSLLEGIHTEAKRAIVLEHMKRCEPWRIWETDNIPAKTLEAHPVNRIDWDRVSTNHVATRSATECLIQWTTQEHPSINKKPWTKPESSLLSKLVEKHGETGQWEKIANELGTNRTISQCFSRYMADQSNQIRVCPKWTKEEDERLMKCVKVLGTSNWQTIAGAVGSRTGQQCLQRWTKSINPHIRRTRWKPEEDEALRRATRFYGAGNWRKIQRLVNARTDMQCRERWVNMLDDKISRAPVTEEEERRILELVDRFGMKWSLISSFMPGRTDNLVMKIFNKCKIKGKTFVKNPEDSTA